MRARDGGFTLMEMLIVLTIMALIAAIALPIARHQNEGTSLKAAAHQIASLMRAARGAAIRDNAGKSLIVDVEGRRVWVDGLTRALTIGRGIVVRLEAPTPRHLRFNSDGSASGGRVVLASGLEAAEITLDALTGTPRLQWRR